MGRQEETEQVDEREQQEPDSEYTCTILVVFLSGTLRFCSFTMGLLVKREV